MSEDGVYAPLKISIHSLRMEGDVVYQLQLVGDVGISIHSLRMEGDIFETDVSRVSTIFQSTPSAWRETSN